MVVGLWRVFYKVTHIPGLAHIKTSVGLCPASYANFSLEEVRRELICAYWMDETNDVWSYPAQHMTLLICHRNH